MRPLSSGTVSSDGLATSVGGAEGTRSNATGDSERSDSIDLAGNSASVAFAVTGRSAGSGSAGSTSVGWSSGSSNGLSRSREGKSKSANVRSATPATSELGPANGSTKLGAEGNETCDNCVDEGSWISLSFLIRSAKRDISAPSITATPVCCKVATHVLKAVDV